MQETTMLLPSKSIKVNQAELWFLNISIPDLSLYIIIMFGSLIQYSGTRERYLTFLQTVVNDFIITRQCINYPKRDYIPVLDTDDYVEHFTRAISRSAKITHNNNNKCP